MTTTEVSSLAEERPRSLARITVGLAPATLAVQALSLISSIALARTLGASASTDAYFLALSVPAGVSAILLAGTRQGAIPTLTSIKHARPTTLSAACSEVVTVTLAASLGLAAVSTAFAFFVVPLAANGSAALADQTQTLILQLAPYSVTGAMAGVLGAILAVEGRFGVAILVMGFEPLLKTIMVLTTGATLGVHSLVIGGLAGSALAVVVLWLLVAHRGIVLRLRRGGDTSVARAVVKISAPLLIGQSVLQLNPVVDRVMASGVSQGSVTVLDLALRLNTAPVALLGSVLIAPLTANWSARHAESGWSGLRESFGKIAVAAAYSLPVIAATLFVLRFPLVRAIYAGGAYSSAAVDETAAVLGMFVLGLPAQLFIVALTTLFVVQSDTLLPMKIAIANVVLNVTLNALLRGPLGVPGIALSTALTLTLLCGAYIFAAHRRWGDLDLRRSRRPLGLSLGSAAIVAAVGTTVVSRVDTTSRWHELLLIVSVVAMALIVHATVLVLSNDRPSYSLPALVQAGRSRVRALRRGRSSTGT